MHEKQKDRMIKADRDGLKLLEICEPYHHGTVAWFRIAGSQGSIYSVGICCNTGNIECTCPDALHCCSNYGFMCKHACFVMKHLLGFDEMCMTKIFHDGHLHMDEIGIVQAIVANGITAWYMSPHFDRYNGSMIQLLSKSPFTTQHEEQVGEPCCICLQLMKNEEALVSCPDCKRMVHTDCVDKWLQSPACNNACILCRSPIWHYYNQSRHSCYDYLQTI